jgi:hypothetical protein
VIWAWEVVVAVEGARAVVVRVAEASTQEAAMTWENVAALVRVVEDRATLAEREA